MASPSSLQQAFRDLRQKTCMQSAMTPSILRNKKENQDENVIPKMFAEKLGKNSPFKGTNKSVRIETTASKILPKTPQPARVVEIPSISGPSSTADVPMPLPQTAEPDLESEIKVFLRQRPILLNEEHADFEINENIVTARPPQKAATTNHYTEKTFTFTKVFPEDSKQEDLFDDIAMPLLKKFIRGYDGLLFAYGATSAGKTHTVRGTSQDPGLIPRMVRALLGVEQPKDAERGLFVSCVEVYNERIHDLLGDTKIPMRIGKDGFGFTVVKNVREVEIREIDELKKILAAVDKAKTVCATSYNANSSRSHCVFMLKMITIPIDRRTRERVTDLTKIRASRLSIVDLAGSERVSPTETSNKMVSEACNINKSMLVLGRCIRDIRKIQMGAKGLQVPYRESKITELFRDFFDPVTARKTYCSIIVNISPSVRQFEDTLFALQFAAEAIECSVKSNIEDTEEEDGDDLIIKPLDFDEDEDETEEIDYQLLKAKEAHIRQEVHQEMTQRCRKIQEDFDYNLSQIRAHSADSCPSKLQLMLAQKVQREQYRSLLEEARRDLDRLKQEESELDKKIDDVEGKLHYVIQKSKEEAVKNREASEEVTSMEGTTRKLEDGLMKIHQRLVELQTKYKQEYENEVAAFEAKLKEII